MGLPHGHNSSYRGDDFAWNATGVNYGVTYGTGGYTANMVRLETDILVAGCKRNIETTVLDVLNDFEDGEFCTGNEILS